MRFLFICLLLLGGTNTALAYDARLADAQDKLQVLDYYNGEVDGLTGPQTRNALRQFQRDQGLTITGEADVDTQGALLDAYQAQRQGNSPNRESRGNLEEQEFEIVEAEPLEEVYVPAPKTTRTRTVTTTRSAAPASSISNTKNTPPPAGSAAEKLREARRKRSSQLGYNFFGMRFNFTSADETLSNDSGSAEFSLDSELGVKFDAGFLIQDSIWLRATAGIDQWSDGEFEVDYQLSTFSIEAAWVFNLLRGGNSGIDLYTGMEAGVLLLSLEDDFGGSADDNQGLLFPYAGVRWQLLPQFELRAELAYGIAGLDGLGAEARVQINPVETFSIYALFEVKNYDEFELDLGGNVQADYDTSSFSIGAEFNF